MRRSIFLAVPLLAVWLGSLQARDPVTGGKKPITKASEGETCGEYGTSLHFEKTPSDAAKKAQKEEKLVFVLHISGHFEDTDFT